MTGFCLDSLRADADYTLPRVHQLGLDAQKRHMSRADRVRLRAALLGHVTRILNDHRGNPTASKFLTKLEGAADDLFEFVLDPRIDSRTTRPSAACTR